MQIFRGCISFLLAFHKFFNHLDTIYGWSFNLLWIDFFLEANQEKNVLCLRKGAMDINESNNTFSFQSIIKVLTSLFHILYILEMFFTEKFGGSQMHIDKNIKLLCRSKESIVNFSGIMMILSKVTQVLRIYFFVEYSFWTFKIGKSQEKPKKKLWIWFLASLQNSKTWI